MISFIIPALNERNAIADTVAKCFSVAREQNWADVEVVVVDDGSTDGTGKLAAEAGAKIVRHPAPGGYGRALKDGMLAAQYDVVVTLDADGTYPIENTPELMRRYNEGFDMVVGRRTGKFYRESALKAPLRSILRFMVEFTTGRSIPDINSGFRVLSRRTIQQFFPQLCDTFSFSTSTTLAYMMTGKFVDYVDIPYTERIGRSKVRLFRDSLLTIQFIVEAIVFFNPLKIFLLLSLLCVTSALGLFLAAILTAVHAFYYLGIGVALTSILVFALGLLAVQLKEIMYR